MSIFKSLKELYIRLVYSPVKYARKKGVTVGENCFLGIREWGSEPYLITIGNRVGIASGVCLHTHGGARVARQDYPEFDIFGKINIKDGAYIGSGSHIMPGVTIGERALIGAGSVVTKSVPANEVWCGNPARKICLVTDYIERNIIYNLNSKSLSPEAKKKLLMALPEKAFIRK